jgi:hypothetical protein
MNNSSSPHCPDETSSLLSRLAEINGTAFEVTEHQLKAFRIDSDIGSPKADTCALCDAPNDSCINCDATDWLNPPTPCITCDEGDQACTFCDAPKDTCEPCDAMDGCHTQRDTCMTCDEGDVCDPVDTR